MKITFCGGAGEVGASCYLVKIDGKNILLDCGIRMKGGKDALPDFRRIQESGGVDAVLVSHAHMDHTGSLPIISREYPSAAIYMTHATKDLVRVLLYDSLKIMNQQEAEIPIYAESHVMNMLDRIVSYSPQFSFKPFHEAEINVTFYHAGHIAGAALIYIKGQEGTLLYTGDVSVTKQQTVMGASIPRLRPDVAIMESTYGDKLHSNRQIEEDRLVDVVREVVTRGGKILIPAFALGRAQEIILILKRAINKKQLPEVPIYVDGMVKDINRVYTLNPNYLTSVLAKKVFRGTDIFYDDNVIPVTQNEMREQIVNEKKSLCVISSSGMLTGGPSAYYAEKFAGSEKNFIAITGYQDEEAPGRHILELVDAEEEERFITINEKTIPLKCGIGKYGLSAHGDKGELQGIVHKLTPKKLFLVHGEQGIIEELARGLNEEVRTQIFVPANGEEYDIKIRNPRKQLVWDKEVQPLHRGEELDGDNVVKLWEHLYNTTGADIGYSVEELIYIWIGRQEFSEKMVEKFREVLNHTPYFVPNPRKLFLYHPVPEEELAKQDTGVMEMNEMLNFVQQLFPEEAGLYKKGAKFEEKICLLHFHFPRKAVLQYKELIKEVEQKTGWTVQTNDDCNLVAAEDLIYTLLPKGTGVEKLSYYRDEGYFLVAVDKRIGDVETIERKFKEITAIDLKVEVPGQKIKPHEVILQPVDTAQMMEQNQAFALVDACFKDKTHKIYKKSKKIQDGFPYMELSFITPQVGQRYEKEIEALKQETGWPMAIGKNPNQNEMMKVVKRILREAGVGVAKNPSIHTSEAVIKIKTVEDVERSLQEELEQQVMEETGYGVVFESK